MKLDFSEVKENKLIPEGEHNLIIKSCKEGKSQNGTPMLTVGLEDAEGGFAMDNICMAGPGAFKAQQFFDALGIEPEQAEEMQASDLVGMELTAKVEIEDYNGEERSRIKKYIA